MLLLSAAIHAEAQTLRGSPAKMERQNRVAQQHDFTFLRTSGDVRRFVDMGLLVPLRGNADYGLAAVSFPYARPAVRTFVERLAAQYRNACGERLIVTSLTRPANGQPRNASPLSVHPTGMAVDLRVPANPRCRRWLENTLLQLDSRGVVSAIRENRPPHYHVAVFPTPYLQYVQRLTGGQDARLATRSAPAPRAAQTQTASRPVPAANQTALPRTAALEDAALDEYRVNRGDSLWSIARRHGTTVEEIKALNGLNSTRIVAGQLLAVPMP